jgi:hypothetical protein
MRYRFTSRRLSSALVATLAACWLAGCAELLPQAATRTQVGWNSYDDARQTIERIVPFQTRSPDLVAMGLTPESNPAITILTYSDILQRFAAGSVMRPEDFDRGIRECLLAGKRCRAYSINVAVANRDRVGNFWLDSLNFKRITDLTGWRFNALVILVDDLVVYTLYGGHPMLNDREVVRNPLGPLQGWGDQVPSLFR